MPRRTPTRTAFNLPLLSHRLSDCVLVLRIFATSLMVSNSSMFFPKFNLSELYKIVGQKDTILLAINAHKHNYTPLKNMQTYIKEYMQGCQTKPDRDWVDALATKIAELRLTELGLNFIPGITPLFTRAKKFIEARVLIVKN